MMRADAPRRAPCIDLHVHLEGSLSRATLAALASRHHLPPPRLAGFDDFAGFLRSFGRVCDLLVDATDFERAAGDLFERSRALGVVHMEVLFSPQVFMRRGIALPVMMTGLLRARRRAMAHGGFSAVYILDGVRQWGAEWYLQTVAAAAPWAGRGLAGVGVGGDEGSRPAREFARAYDRARALGLRTTIHAGEAAGPDSIREALTDLRVERIGHGVRAVEDPGLVRDLAARGICLELCPSSNVATGVVPSWKTHPLRALYDAGVTLTLNTDDGAFFDTDIIRERDRARRFQGFGEEELRALTRNAARHAFLPARARAHLERKVDVIRGPAGRPVRAGRSPRAAGSAS